MILLFFNLESVTQKWGNKNLAFESVFNVLRSRVTNSKEEYRKKLITLSVTSFCVIRFRNSILKLDNSELYILQGKKRLTTPANLKNDSNNPLFCLCFVTLDPATFPFKPETYVHCSICLYNYPFTHKLKRILFHNLL